MPFIHSPTTSRCVHILAAIHCNGFEIGRAHDGIGSSPAANFHHAAASSVTSTRPPATRTTRHMNRPPHQHESSQDMPAAFTLLQHFSTTAAPRIAIFISSRVLQAPRAFACARCRIYAAVTIVSYRKCDAAATNALFVSILLSFRLSHPANAATLNSTNHVACGSSNFCPRSRFTAHVRSRPTVSCCHDSSVFAPSSFV